MSGEYTKCGVLMTAEFEKNESLFELIEQATMMLLDRTQSERDLIYYIAKMEPDLRSGIILAYQNLNHGTNDER